MGNLNTAKKLGISHKEIELFYCANNKKWSTFRSSELMSLEAASLGLLKLPEWNGYASEGSLILNVIKAASFKELPQRNQKTYIEALYAQNVAFDEDRYTCNELIQNIRDSDVALVTRNIEVMFNSEIKTINFELNLARLTFISEGNIKDYFPDLYPEIMIDFYISIGRERLSKIAELFAEDPYEYRKGWPDLTLWDPESGQIIFREIKAPGDKIRPSQKKMIEKILLPLGYNVGVVDVRRAAEAL
jgi:VRR-NUC domain